MQWLQFSRWQYPLTELIDPDVWPTSAFGPAYLYKTFRSETWICSWIMDNYDNNLCISFLQIKSIFPKWNRDRSPAMSVIALFRNKWGQKAQDAPSKQRVAEVLQSSRNEEDEDEDSATGFSREPIRRNSRFYRSMRKKKTAGPTEQTDSKKLCCLVSAEPHQRRRLILKLSSVSLV